jgi:hypothetical protein
VGGFLLLDEAVDVSRVGSDVGSSAVDDKSSLREVSTSKNWGFLGRGGGGGDAWGHSAVRRAV